MRLKKVQNKNSVILDLISQCIGTGLLCSVNHKATAHIQGCHSERSPEGFPDIVEESYPL